MKRMISAHSSIFPHYLILNAPGVLGRGMFSQKTFFSFPCVPPSRLYQCMWAVLYEIYRKTLLSLFQQETGGGQREVRETHAQVMISFLEMFCLLCRRSLRSTASREKKKNICFHRLDFHTIQNKTSGPVLLKISDSLHGAVVNYNFTINSSQSDTIAYEKPNISHVNIVKLKSYGHKRMQGHLRSFFFPTQIKVVNIF